MQLTDVKWADPKFSSKITPGADDKSEPDEDEMMLFADEGGGIFPTRPQNPTKSRNKPGQAETAKRGAAANFQCAPTTGNRPRARIRCGCPSHLAQDCPHPLRPILDPKFSTNFAKKHANIHPPNDSAESPIEMPTPSNNSGNSEEQKRIHRNRGGWGKNENELCEIREEFYRSPSSNQTCIVNVEWDVNPESTPNMNGRKGATESPPIL